MEILISIFACLAGILLASSEAPYIVNLIGALMFFCSCLVIGTIIGEGSVKNG